jgi:hypothetical protein
MFYIVLYFYTSYISGGGYISCRLHKCHLAVLFTSTEIRKRGSDVCVLSEREQCERCCLILGLFGCFQRSREVCAFAALNRIIAVVFVPL